MGTGLNPYIAFPGSARPAMEFYESVFGGSLTIHPFSEYPTPEGVEGPDPDGVMHAMLEAPNGLTLMASDLAPGMSHQPGGNITISLSGDDAGELHGYWDKLSGSGSVTMPLEMQMWGDEFGMCVDQFGVPWMVNIAGSGNAGS